MRSKTARRREHAAGSKTLEAGGAGGSSATARRKRRLGAPAPTGMHPGNSRTGGPGHGHPRPSRPCPPFIRDHPGEKLREPRRPLGGARSTGTQLQEIPGFPSRLAPAPGTEEHRARISLALLPILLVDGATSLHFHSSQVGALSGTTSTRTTSAPGTGRRVASHSFSSTMPLDTSAVVLTHLTFVTVRSLSANCMNAGRDGSVRVLRRLSLPACGFASYAQAQDILHTCLTALHFCAEPRLHLGHIASVTLVLYPCLFTLCIRNAVSFTKIHSHSGHTQGAFGHC